MKTIYKYPLQTVDDQDIEMPIGAKILTVKMQHGQPCLWALVDPNVEYEKRRILVRGTGHKADDVGEYICTFLIQGGTLVCHVFEPPSKEIENQAS